MIKAKNLRKVFQTSEIETTAVNNVNFNIDEGEFVAIMGPSGCGKSTLLNIIGLLDSPTGGSYNFLGNEVGDFNEKQRANIRKENIGFVFQSFNLIDELTVFENVELPLLYHKIPKNEVKIRTKEILERMQLTPRSKHYPQQLSGGQQQRVAVARALVTKPKLILADEPTGNLDSKNGDEVMEMLKQLNKSGTTIIMVTHSPEYAKYADRVIRLFDGEIVDENTQEKFHL